VRQRLNPNFVMTGMGLMRVAPAARRGGHRMRGLGAAMFSPRYSIGPVPVIGGTLSPILSTGPRGVQPVGPIVERGVTFNPVATQPAPTSGTTSTTSTSSSGTVTSPVPAGYPTNQFYVASDGSVWEYAAAQNQWIPIEGPFGSGASAGATPTTPQVTAALAPSSAPAPAAGVTASSPLPYIAGDGSVWAYNPTSGATYQVYAANASLATAAAAGQAQISSDGSVWMIVSGTWTQVDGPNATLASASFPAPPGTTGGVQSDYQSVLNWLQESSLIPSVPNWIVGVGVFVGVKLLLNKSAAKGRG
jgi:hypothetical protein